MRRKFPRPISRTSRKPSVVTTPVRAPWPASTALMPIVVPWIISRQSARSTAACSAQRRTPSSSSDGVLRALALTTAPVASSSATRSVNVPPMSTPILSATRAPSWRGSIPEASARRWRAGVTSASGERDLLALADGDGGGLGLGHDPRVATGALEASDEDGDVVGAAALVGERDQALARRGDVGLGRHDVRQLALGHARPQAVG